MVETNNTPIDFDTYIFFCDKRVKNPGTGRGVQRGRGAEEQGGRGAGEK
jgi:hypothetical protein